MDNPKGSTFTFAYSAERRKEIEDIRAKFDPKSNKESSNALRQTETKMEQLRCLDKEAERPGRWITAAGITAGVLLLGSGLSMILTLSRQWFSLGLALGAVGIAFLCISFPLGQHITKKQRETLAPQVLKLTDELSARYDRKEKGEK